MNIFCDGILFCNSMHAVALGVDQFHKVENFD